MGFALNTHFCQGKAVDSSISMGVEHLDCGMPKMDSNKNEGEQLSKQSCCKNLHQVIEVDNNQENGFPTFDLNHAFLISFVNTFVFDFLKTESKLVSFYSYSPPLPDKDVQVLFQTFLI